jgi:putative phosphoribosyl transferase
MMIDQHRIFVDRRDAGFELGKLLEDDYKGGNALVLGIPRGGVIVACEVAKVLDAELSVVITKKLSHPLQKELAIGAAAEDGSIFLISSARSFSDDTIREIFASQSREIQSRIQRFRRSKPLPPIHDRLVIIVDDGIATGSTVVPAIKLCKHRHAAKVIVAAPVSGQHYVSEIDDLADDVVIAEQPETFIAVGQVYEDFHNLSDTEVLAALNEFEQNRIREAPV